MDPEIFKVNLKGLLEAKGMTQRELADRCEISYEWVRRVCSRGLTRVEDRNRNQLVAICDLLGVSPFERLWSPDLQPGRGEAAWYGAKVEEILNATRSMTHFNTFEPINESSIADLKKLIDLMHLALKENQERLALRHEASLDQQRGLGGPITSRTHHGSKRLQEASEYTAKLSQIFRTNSIGNSRWLSFAANVIDALFFEKQANRVATIFRDRNQKGYEDWLVYFGNRQTFENVVAVALATFHEDQVLTWVTSHSPPDDPRKGTIADWTLIREWMAVTRRESLNDSSTAGGNIASGR